MGFFDKIKAGLTKTREALGNTLSSVFAASEIDDDFYDELEESLILADLGVETALKAVEKLRKTVKEQHLREAKADFDRDAECGRHPAESVHQACCDPGDRRQRCR